MRPGPGQPRPHTTATLRLVRGTSSGTNPFTTHGSCVADIVTGGFGGSNAFANADWQAAATGVATLIGATQLRIGFTLDDNDDVGYDYIGFYAGENATLANRPQLTVTYQP